MPTHAPHLMITGSLTAGAHYTQAGSELVKWLLAEQAPPSLGMVSAIAVNLSIAMFVVRVVPMIFRGYLKFDAAMGDVERQCIAWGQRKLVAGATWMIAQLGQDSPRQ